MPASLRMTKIVVYKESHRKILNVLKTGKKEYLSFRNEQYIGKSKNLTAQISNIKLHSFRSLESNNSNFSQSLETVESKVIALAQIKMDIELL